MARNKFPGICYCCGKVIPPGYGHFELNRNRKPGEAKWLIKCVKCASGRVLKKDDPGVKWAEKAYKEAVNTKP